MMALVLVDHWLRHKTTRVEDGLRGT